MSLTDTAIQALKPREHRYDVTDREGLMLEVHPSGKKRYRYRLNGKREKVTLGAYPAVGLKLARERRLSAEKQVAANVSPALARRRQKEAEKGTCGAIRTVEDLAEHWIEHVLRPASKSADQDETYVRRDLLPRIGSLALDVVAANDIWSCAEVVMKRGHDERRPRSNRV